MGRAFEYRRGAKEARWDKMSKLFPKLAKGIEIAAKEGGSPDPAMNAKLRGAIATAKAQNMPKDNIDAAIKRAFSKDATDLKAMHYEAKAAHGVQLIIEVTTNNANRSAANIAAILSRANAQRLVNGSLDFIFTRKSVITTAPLAAGRDLEALELDLIDAGLESLEVLDDGIEIIGSYEAFGSLCKEIEAQGLEIKSALLKYLPTSSVTLDDEQLESIEKLIDKLEDDEDVVAVHTNIE